MSASINGRNPESPSRSVWLLAAPSLAVSATLLAVAVLAAVSVFQMQREADSVLEEIATANSVSSELEQSVEELRLSLARYEATGDDAEIRQARHLQQDMGQYLLTIERLRIGQRELVVTSLRRNFDDLSHELDEVASDTSAAARHADEFLSETRRQREAAQRALQEAQQQSHALTRWTGWTLLFLGVLGAGAGTLAGFGLARSMQRQLVQLSVPIQSAAGSLDELVGPLQVSATGNIDQLEGSLHELADHVSSVVERLQAAERESLRNDQMAALGQLAAGLAHELRNPLTAMKTLVEAARGDGPDAQLDQRDLAVLEEEIRRLDGTLQEFLDYARPPAVRKTVIDLRDVTEKTVQLVSARADQQSIRLNVKLPERPLQLKADAGQLRQVVLNLLLNALDSVRRGGNVSVEAERNADDVVIRVRDDGPGISESVRDRLFEPFVSSKPSGTGLGLTICRRIVENHGGQITARNRAGGGAGGAEFTVRLPVGEVPSDVQAPVDVASRAVAASAGCGLIATNLNATKTGRNDGDAVDRRR